MTEDTINGKVEEVFKLTQKYVERHQLVRWILQSAEMMGLINTWTYFRNEMQFMYMTNEQHCVIIQL
jgi:hypothetical protein